MENVISYFNVDIMRQDIRVLKNINLTVSAGEFLYIIGKVGSGKSSLLKSMYAEVPVASGNATVLGYDLTQIKRREIPFLRRKTGIVFQDFRLLNDRNVHKNLEFVLKATGWKDSEEMENRIQQSLKQIGMENKSYKMPYELSGGEQQQVVIARAMLNNPALLLVDEPTANLDSTTASQIMARLHDISKEGTTVIVATHNLQLPELFPAHTLECVDRTLS